MTSSESWKEGPWEESEHREEGGRRRFLPLGTGWRGSRSL